LHQLTRSLASRNRRRVVSIQIRSWARKEPQEVETNFTLSLSLSLSPPGRYPPESTFAPLCWRERTMLGVWRAARKYRGRNCVMCHAAQMHIRSSPHICVRRDDNLFSFAFGGVCGRLPWNSPRSSFRSTSPWGRKTEIDITEARSSRYSNG